MTTDSDSKPQNAGVSGQAVIATPLWNKPGHGVLAFIAQAYLENQEANVWGVVDNIMQNDPSGRSSIAVAARWPDDAKSDPEFKKKTGMYHFVDLAWQEGTEPAADAPMPAAPHAVSELPKFTETMVTGEGTDQADALCWVLHLVGDLHQPLHCITRVNDANPAPDGDRGGNNFKLSGHFRDLHTVWDGLLITNDKASETSLRKIAAAIAQEIPYDSVATDLAIGDPEAWAREGYAIAATEAYQNLDEGGAPSDDYMTNAKAIARRRAAIGGYRLANLLVQRFKNAT